MCEPPAATIVEHFSTIKDHRMDGKIRHKLTDIIILSIIAVICGADEFKQIEEYGNVKSRSLKESGCESAQSAKPRLGFFGFE
jgi:hypothetical protein